MDRPGLGGDDLTLVRGVSFGRYRFSADDPQSASVGWLADHTQLETDDPLLPERLFLSQSRTELGLRYQTDRGFTWSAAAGLIFGQEFNRGFDTRNLDLVREVDSAAFLRVGVTASF